MRRSEAAGLLAFALLALTAGLTWLFGPFALIGAGFAVAAVAFALEVHD